MSSLSRRQLILSGGACAILGPTPVAAAAQPPAVDALQDWISGHAVPVRSIDMSDGDFEDLEPLAAAIGSARIVQLGEPSHGAGTGFAAKARLVRFLHERMGFDVLTWESGMYDLRLTQAALEAGEDAVAAAQRGILRIWSASEECRPLFEHAKGSLAGRRPLEMAGFDMQFTSREGPGRFAADLTAFARAVPTPSVRQRAPELAERAATAFARLHAYVQGRARAAAAMSRASLAGAARTEAMAEWESREGAALRPVRADFTRLEQAADALRDAIGRHREDFVRIHGTRETSFMDRAVDNLVGYGANVYEQFGADRPSGAEAATLDRENRRDALNAANLRWTVEQGYPGRKIIVWAHNAHVMNAYYGSDWASLSLEPRPDAMKPTGVYLAGWYGDDVYTIGITAYEGEDGFAGSPQRTSIAPAVSGGLEARLHGLGLPCAFLDFRGLEGQTGHPMRRPLPMRVPKYEDELVADPTRPYDGILFIDRMAPATAVGAPGDAA